MFITCDLEIVWISCDISEMLKTFFLQDNDIYNLLLESPLKPSCKIMDEYDFNLNVTRKNY